MSISQGVWGHTWFWDGIFSPDGSRCDVYPTVTAISAGVLAYPAFPLKPYRAFVRPYPGDGLVPRADLEAEFGVEAVAATTSTRSGFFEIPLEPGDYALLVAFGDELYGPRGDPIYVTVSEGEVTFSDFEIRERPEE